jgi:hypothetical protein
MSAMSISTSSKWLFLIAGFYTLACIPIILIADHYDWLAMLSDKRQVLAVALCFPASVVFLWSTRGSRFDAQRWLAAVASVLCGLWLAFVGYAVMTFAD